MKKMIVLLLAISMLFLLCACRETYSGGAAHIRGIFLYEPVEEAGAQQKDRSNPRYFVIVYDDADRGESALVRYEHNGNYSIKISPDDIPEEMPGWEHKNSLWETFVLCVAEFLIASVIE